MSTATEQRNFLGAFDAQARFVCEECLTDAEKIEVDKEAAAEGERWTPLFTSDAWGYQPCARCNEYPERP